MDKKLWEDDWELLMPYIDTMYIVARKKLNLTLHLKCTAPYAIEWARLYEGQYERHSQCDSFPRLDNELLVYSKTLTFQSSSSWRVPIRFECRASLHERERRTSSHRISRITVHLFYPQKETLIRIPYSTVESLEDQGDIVPCASTDPRVPVTLSFKDHVTGEIEKVSNSTHHPDYGFVVYDYHKQGEFICSAGEETLTFRAQRKYGSETNFVLQKTLIRDKCRESDGTMITPEGNTSEKIWISLPKQYTYDKEGLVSMGPYKNLPFEPPSVKTLFIYCIQHDKIGSSVARKKGRLLKKLEVKPIEDIDANVNAQNSIKPNVSYYLSNNYTFERRSHPLEWDEFPFDEYIFMPSGGVGKFYTDTVSIFTCKTNKQTSQNVTLWLETSDGEFSQILNGSRKSAQINVKNKPKLLFTSWTLKIQLKAEDVAIQCRIPTNVDEGLYWAGERRFETKILQRPRIRNLQSIYQFQIGQNNENIVCLAEGEPTPVYFWKKDTQDVNNVSAEMEITIGEMGESILTFANVKKSHSGLYSCTAKNRGGKVIYNFTVIVEDLDEGNQMRTTFTVLAFILIFALAVCIVGIYRYYVAKNLQRVLNDQEIKLFLEGRPDVVKNVYDQEVLGNFDALPYNMALEINSEDAIVDNNRILGGGEFATVLKGFIKSKQVDVAVKVAKVGTDVTLFKALLSEVKILSFIGSHRNIVGLVGVNTKDIRNRNLSIYIDLCELGSLEKYLRFKKHRFLNLVDENQQIVEVNCEENSCEKPINTADLIRWCADIATGMEYLSFKSIVHADLAARNILLTNDTTARVSDFGLSRKLFESNFYVKKTKSPLPWRWMALESLKTLTFSAHSDVWAYGITLWEVFSLGDVPFPNEEWNNAFVEKLASGIRMGQPKFATPQIYSKIMECWEEIPANRPTFSLLRHHFWKFYETMSSSVVYVTALEKTNVH